MKSISTINPAITENMDGTIVKVHATVIDIKVGVSPNYGVSLHFIWLPGLWTFSYHCKQRITLQTPLLALHLPKSHTGAITCVPQIITNAIWEKGMEYKGEQKVSFGRTMMQAMELLRLAKSTSPDKATLNSEEIKPVAIAIIELRLSECISKGVSEWVSKWVNESVENSEFLKFHNSFLEWVRNDLKTFLNLAMTNLYCLDVTK